MTVTIQEMFLTKKTIQNSSRNSEAVMHLGRSISRLRKSLSPVMIKSTSDRIAALKIG